jgi:hypothetical protein
MVIVIIVIGVLVLGLVVSIVTFRVNTGYTKPMPPNPDTRPFGNKKGSAGGGGN